MEKAIGSVIRTTSQIGEINHIKRFPQGTKAALSAKNRSISRMQASRAIPLAESCSHKSGHDQRGEVLIELKRER